MVLIIKGHDFKFELENICRLFLPLEKITVIDQSGEATDDSGITAVSVLKDDGGRLLLYSELTVDGRTEAQRNSLIKRLFRQGNREETLGADVQFTRKAFQLYTTVGAVTGVRPVKLMRSMPQKRAGGGGRWFWQSFW